MRIARGSLLETRNHVLKAKANGYITDEESVGLLRLQSRATGAVTSLLRYLDSCKGKAPTGWDQPAADKETSKQTDSNAAPKPSPRIRTRTEP